MDIMLFLPLILLVLMMVFMWRSNKKNQERQQQLRAQLAPGVEVMTQSGIYGTVIEIDHDLNTAIIETTPGTNLKVHSATIVNVVSPDVVVPDDASSLTDDTAIADDAAPRTDATDAPAHPLADEVDASDTDGDDETNNEQPKA